MAVPEADLGALRRWFNDNADQPRIIALMSPTCGFCLIGHQAIRTYHSWLQDADFVTKRIWVPMMPPDSREHADQQAATTDDERISDMYDARHVVGRVFRDVLGLAAVAWDTYLLYMPGKAWTEDLPPAPDECQYQLWPSYAPDQTRLFTPSAFWWKVVAAVGRSRDDYDAQVLPLAAWLNDDHQARVGLEVPESYRRHDAGKGDP